MNNERISSPGVRCGRWDNRIKTQPCSTVNGDNKDLTSLGDVYSIRVPEWCACVVRNIASRNEQKQPLRGSTSWDVEMIGTSLNAGIT